ncbi:MAG: hypothetical protein AAB922_02755, partial [Patescibacteria group bacterium]
AIQGNLTLANDQVKRAVDLRYDPIKSNLELLNKQLEFNYKSLDASEKRRADALKAVNDAKLKELEVQRANEKDKNSTLLNQMQSYPDANITLTDTLESANIKITTKSKIYQDKIKGPEGTTTTNYSKALQQGIEDLYGGTFGTTGAREKLLTKLQSLFPGKDIAKDIYSRVQDGYEKNIVPKQTAPVVKAGRLQELLIKSENGQNLDSLSPAEQAELYSLL